MLSNSVNQFLSINVVPHYYQKNVDINDLQESKRYEGFTLNCLWWDPIKPSVTVKEKSHVGCGFASRLYNEHYIGLYYIYCVNVCLTFVVNFSFHDTHLFSFTTESSSCADVSGLSFSVVIRPPSVMALICRLLVSESSSYVSGAIFTVGFIPPPVLVLNCYLSVPDSYSYVPGPSFTVDVRFSPVIMAIRCPSFPMVLPYL
ncbi:hypothetical protein AVEN_50532-1 [Araneus ventricosus]|uniref:Uncharacterized protein n=1 Tax=Araneus ventricosus TaxID=182803 RepID=A0A4Y2AR18_ARAVE|nr:hypothetical protein AVEN_50532-1 [Araneus ventricosus]